MRSPTPPLLVTDEQRSVLEKLYRSRVAAHRDVLRARALLMVKPMPLSVTLVCPYRSYGQQGPGN